jgi:hypothetical protein
LQSQGLGAARSGAQEREAALTTWTVHARIRCLIVVFATGILMTTPTRAHIWDR